MKSRSYYIFLFSILVVAGVASCSDDGESLRIYMPDAKTVVNANFDISDTIYYTASLVGADYPTASATTGKAVTVEFKVDADKVAAFNQAMGTSYELLPAANYVFETSGTIAKGESRTAPLKLIVKDGDALEAFSNYLLPLSIDKVDGGEAGRMQQTTYFILTRSPALENLPAFDRSTWTIADKSTEEPNEGGGNGLAIALIDGNWGSFWHSKWAGGEPAPPHYVTIDMGELKEIHGISIVDRNLGSWEHGQPKGLTVAVSADGVTFESAGSYPSVPMKSDPQEEIRYFLSSTKTARYIKVTVTSTWGGTNSTSVAEIYAM